MSKKLILAAALFITAATVSISVLILEKKDDAPAATADSGKTAPAEAGGKIILFYGDGCPHCLDVENFLDRNEASKKIDYESKEVWNDAANRDLLIKIATFCGLSQKSVGVPFLWDGKNEKCLIGEDQVTAFFQTKLNQAPNITPE